MTSKNITLRALEPSDVNLLYKWENDTSIWHLSNTLTPFSRFVLEQYLLNSEKDIFTNKQLRLMIDVTEADKKVKTIGSIDLFDFDPKNKRAGIGILIIKEEREKGFASIALDLLIKYTFETLDLHQVYCNIPYYNEISLNLFKKKHFKIIGVKKDWIIKNGKWIDEYMLQLVNNNQ
ncbi:MAG: GNAT family N-acetyltransferase [Bacteroidetes bacterium]|jgi:diamine N-acetyltransferase|nr:GNAT family N-acetyltransferase [Bacteroidota bacterium]MCK4361615.1 GNAT family N-acetyltransferase [Bacteroidales bacterium]MCK4638275.1 GNAT family N-acetyltransferase [Bacteroidales bacterium]